jgi:hypothetical protein
MQRRVAWNQQLDAEHGHGLWAVILRATDEYAGWCFSRCRACRRLSSRNPNRGAKEFRDPFFCLTSSPQTGSEKSNGRTGRSAPSVPNSEVYRPQTGEVGIHPMRVNEHPTALSIARCLRTWRIVRHRSG